MASVTSLPSAKCLIQSSCFSLKCNSFVKFHKIQYESLSRSAPASKLCSPMTQLNIPAVSFNITSNKKLAYHGTTKWHIQQTLKTVLMLEFVLLVRYSLFSLHSQGKNVFISTVFGFHPENLIKKIWKRRRCFLFD